MSCLFSNAPVLSPSFFCNFLEFYTACAFCMDCEEFSSLVVLELFRSFLHAKAHSHLRSHPAREPASAPPPVCPSAYIRSFYQAVGNTFAFGFNDVVKAKWKALWAEMQAARSLWPLFNVDTREAADGEDDFVRDNDNNNEADSRSVSLTANNGGV